MANWLKKIFHKPEFSNHPKPEFAQFLLKTVGFNPKDLNVFCEAFTHKSVKNESKKSTIDFERLEFLGDAVISLVIGDYLFQKAPNKQEGYLTRMRAKIVSRQHLNEIGLDLKLMDYIIVANQASVGDDTAGDLFEALVGAIFVDQGYHAAERFIMKKVVEVYVDLNKLENLIISYKSFILEWSQKAKKEISFNTFEEDNAEDVTIFVSVIRGNEKVIAKGRGTSKKRAEENASKRAYYTLQKVINNHN